MNTARMDFIQSFLQELNVLSSKQSLSIAMKE